MNTLSKVRNCAVINNIIEFVSPATAPNVSGSKRSGFVTKEKITSGSFSEKFKSGHFVGAENTRFAIVSKLFEKLPAESSFTGGRSRTDDVTSGSKELIVVDVGETSFAIGVIFEISNVIFKVMGEIRGDG